MAMQVHHVAQLDRDVAEEVTKWLKYLKARGKRPVPHYHRADPKDADKWRVQYEAYITYQQ